MNRDEMVQRATNPKQYDLTDLNFPEISSADTPFRRMLWGYIKDQNFALQGSDILDIGCGTGWLLQRLYEESPASVTGIEPGEENCKIAKTVAPHASVTCTDLFSHSSDEVYDYVFMVLASDYFEDVKSMYTKLKSFLKPGGTLITFDPDYEYNRTPRLNYELKIDDLSKDEYLISVTRPSGTMVGFVRTTDYTVRCAEKAGLVLQKSVPVRPTEEFLKEQPQYKPVSHLSITNMNIFKLN